MNDSILFFFLNNSVIYSNNAFIVLDAEWPDEYNTSVLYQTNVNYIIYDKQQVLFYSVFSLNPRIFFVFFRTIIRF